MKKKLLIGVGVLMAGALAYAAKCYFSKDEINVNDEVIPNENENITEVEEETEEIIKEEAGA